ncbi:MULTISPECIES: hypothetical protein [Mycobacterium]|uniref:Transmembrane protein n=1 Tax=Mycobacterium colombiense TaxID=339268 RepID=A0A329M5Y3_9MYCO|nr:MULTISPECIES: hypothetical protein [Mycobacterium]MDM4138750.1 hypothetical protein [Mycobacterium sp. FLAC0960]RAV14043.1 hypothetical protein DQP57_06635 [Mycobacterium colombiense]
MSHFSDWFNYQASLKILLFAMLAGAALPGLFALGLRFQAIGAGEVGTDGGSPQKNPMLLAVAWAIFAMVFVVIAFALAYISRDFIAHQTGTAFLGAKPK